MNALVNKIYTTGDWPKDFLDVKMISLPKKNRAMKCRDHRTICLISQNRKIVASTLRSSGVATGGLDGALHRGPKAQGALGT